MRVADLMQTEVLTVRPEAAVTEIVVSLADAHVSALPVVDDCGRILGVVSSTDVIAAEAEAEDQVARESLFESTQAREIMTPQAWTISPEADVKDAARQMLYADVHRLFVVAERRLVGVLSTTDIVRAIATGRL